MLEILALTGMVLSFSIPVYADDPAIAPVDVLPDDVFAPMPLAPDDQAIDNYLNNLIAQENAQMEAEAKYQRMENDLQDLGDELEQRLRESGGLAEVDENTEGGTTGPNSDIIAELIATADQLPDPRSNVLPNDDGAVWITGPNAVQTLVAPDVAVPPEPMPPDAVAPDCIDSSTVDPTIDPTAGLMPGMC